MSDFNENYVETDDVEVIDNDDIFVEDDDDGGSGILSLLIAGAVGAGLTYGATKVIPKIKAKKLAHDKKKLEKLQAKVTKAEAEDIDVDELTPLSDEEMEQIEEIEAEVKESSKTKKKTK